MTKLDHSLDNIKNNFKLPIEYAKNTNELNPTIVADLELVKTIEETETPIYNNVFQPTNSFGKKMMEYIPNYYTTNIKYLKDTQTLLKKYNHTPHIKFNTSDHEEFLGHWNEVKGETSFCEKYMYMEWDYVKFLNKDNKFLQIMCMYTLASPLISFLLPFLMLIVPFIIIKFKGLSLSLKEYLSILSSMLSNNSIYKIFTQFSEVDMNQKIYLIVSAFFYLFSIYQNIMVCVKFYTNMKKIHEYLFSLRKYLGYSIELMQNYTEMTEKLETYTEFNQKTKENMLVLSKYKSELDKIYPLEISLRKIYQFGDIMKLFYELYNDENLHNSILYSFGFNGYIDNINGLISNMNMGRINSCSFNTTSNKKPSFKGIYYPKFVNNIKHVRNNVNLNKNILITGPNASGKTTMLKTILINSILNQQFGVGCYSSCKTNVFDDFHCYLNIPDTCGRDSLFQAEARRCKDIIDIIDEDKTKTHLCIFDEIYSGTNPEEAVKSASAFMLYLTNKKNICSLLTTHYTELCKNLDKQKSVVNYRMKIEKKENNMIKYTYLLEEGISEVKGAMNVLTEMQYPKEILDMTGE